MKCSSKLMKARKAETLFTCPELFDYQKEHSEKLITSLLVNGSSYWFNHIWFLYVLVNETGISF